MVKIWPSQDDAMYPNTPKPPPLQKHYRSCSPPRRQFHPNSSHTLSHLGASLFGDFNSAILQQWQQIIPDLCLQLRGSILPRVHDVPMPSSLICYGARWFFLHAIPTIKRPSSRLLQQISTCRSYGCEDHARIICPHARKTNRAYIASLFQREGDLFLSESNKPRLSLTQRILIILVPHRL